MITLPFILLFLFVLNLGTAFGAGLYEMRIVLPLWFRRSADGRYAINHRAMQQMDVGRKFWGMVTTLPLTLLTLASVFVAWQWQGPVHGWWLAATAVVLIERVGTFAFFIPTAIRMASSDVKPLEDVDGVVKRWVWLNYVRNLLTIVGFGLGLLAVGSV